MKNNSKKLCSLLLACAMMVTAVVSASATKVEQVDDDVVHITVTEGQPQTFYLDGFEVTAAIVPSSPMTRVNDGDDFTVKFNEALFRRLYCSSSDGNQAVAGIRNYYNGNDYANLSASITYTPGSSAEGKTTIVEGTITPWQTLSMTYTSQSGNLSGNFLYRANTTASVGVPVRYFVTQSFV